MIVIHSSDNSAFRGQIKRNSLMKFAMNIFFFAGSMEIDWEESYKIIKTKHDEAYHAVVEAIKLEEEEKPEKALAHYKLGIALIDEALTTPVALPDDEKELDETWTSAIKMIQKMKRSRADVLVRISSISSKLPSSVDGTSSTDEASVVTENRPRTFSELGEALKNLQYTADDVPNTLDLLFLCEGVKVYHIAKTGQVTTTDESSTLRIVRLEKDAANNLATSYFMQIIRSSIAAAIIVEPLSDDDNESVNDDTVEAEGAAALPAAQQADTRKSVSDNSLIYPLVAGASPCFLTEYGAFIFPDLESTVAGAAIGLIIPDEYSELALEIFEAILHGVYKQGRSPANLSEWDDIPAEEHGRVRRGLSVQISSGIVRGAGHLSNGLVKGSEKVGEMITNSTPFIISKLKRAPENTPPVSNKVISGVEMAKTATGVAVNVTGYVAGKVGSATMALGRFLSPHVQCQGSKILVKTGMNADKAAETVSTYLFLSR